MEAKDSRNGALRILGDKVSSAGLRALRALGACVRSGVPWSDSVEMQLSIPGILGSDFCLYHFLAL